MPKKAVIINLEKKPIVCVGVSEMSTDEYLRLQTEAKKNLEELLDKRDELLKEIDQIKEDIEHLKEEIKVLKGE